MKAKEIAELEQWFRAESPLASFARSLRAEDKSTDPSTTGAQGQQQQQATGDNNKATDPFEGLDLDELPDDVRETIEKARKDVAILQSDKQRLEAERVNLDKLARDHQSRADRFQERLKSHNLLDDGNGNGHRQQVDASDEIAEDLKAQFTADGMKPEVAGTYANMFAKSQKLMIPSLLKQIGTALGPMSMTVGNLQADRLLSAAQDGNAILQIPEVLTAVRSNVAALVQSGSPVSAGTIDSLTKMAYGELAMTKPEILKQQTQQPPMKLHSRGGNGMTSHITLPPNQRNGEPVPADAETARAASIVAEQMKRGMGKKGGK